SREGPAFLGNAALVDGNDGDALLGANLGVQRPTQRTEVFLKCLQTATEQGKNTNGDQRSSTQHNHAGAHRHDAREQGERLEDLAYEGKFGRHQGVSHSVSPCTLPPPISLTNK